MTIDRWMSTSEVSFLPNYTVPKDLSTAWKIIGNFCINLMSLMIKSIVTMTVTDRL